VRPAAERAGTETEPVVVVSDRGRVVRVPVADVLYLKAELKYVTLRTAQHTYVLDDALSDLEQRLGERFIRVHRNALVARRAVRALERASSPAPRTRAARAGRCGSRRSTNGRGVAPAGRAVREALVAAGL
jgi:two-component system response regulator AlgR